MKKINALIVAALSLSMLAACAPAAPAPADPSAPPAAVEPSASVAPADPSASVAPVDPAAPAADGALTGPYLVTSCGQSPGAVMINMTALQKGLVSTNDNGISASDFAAGDYKTLIVTTGTSGKGMGAAGTDVNAEIARCTDLIKAAKDAGLTIVGAHVEGMARRTDAADAASIEAVMSLADSMLVITESDSDGFFTKYAADNNKPLHVVKDALDIASVLN